MSESALAVDYGAINAKQTELYWLNNNLGHLQHQESLANQRAEDLRRVAAAIGRHTDPLRNIFTGIRRYHTTDTWEGNAATESRARLDTNEDRTTSAIIGLDALVDDLTAEAVIADGDAADAAGRASSTRWHITVTERELWNLRNPEFG